MRRTHSDRLSGRYTYSLNRNGTKTSELPYYNPRPAPLHSGGYHRPRPQRPPALNQFTYVNHNSVRYFDPTGYKKVGWFPVGNVIVQPKQVCPSPILLVLQMSVLTVHRMSILRGLLLGLFYSRNIIVLANTSRCIRCSIRYCDKTMIMKLLSLITLLFICITLCGCNVLQPTTFLMDSKVLEVSTISENSIDISQGNLQLLLDEKCRLMQWQGFIPHKTKTEQVLWWLKNNPPIIEFEPYEVKGDNGEWVSEINGFYTAISNPSTKIYFTLVFLENTNILETIILDINDAITLEDIIEYCGEPSEVSAYITHGVDTPETYWTVYVLWKDRGLLVRSTTTLEEGSEPPPIDENLPFNQYVQLISPDTEIRVPHWQQFFTWQGYQPFEFYAVVRPE
jgi:hypothetical protein